jgi:UMF1 family MFS transporter
LNVFLFLFQIYSVLDKLNSKKSIKGDKKAIRAWWMFDWANSVYQLSITSAILPAYYHAVSTKNGTQYVDFFGFQVLNTSLYAWAVSAAFLIVALISPLLGVLADATGRRLLFMRFFTWLGALSCASLYFLTPQTISWGMLSFVLAGVGYSGALVFYNAWLPEIAPEGKEDQISAKGYALGYLGGIILLLINLSMILHPEWYGIEGKGMPARISFITVGVWWLLFAQITFKVLPDKLKPSRTDNLNRSLYTRGYRELMDVWKKFKADASMLRYLMAYFFTMMAVLTIMYMAANFGKKELGLDDKVLIPTVLLIQLLGIAGALVFARIAERIGSIRTLQALIMVWIALCCATWFVQTAAHFMILASGVGLVMGAVQALARSGWAKLLPDVNEHTAFFSFYDVTEKLSVVSGTFLFGLLEWLTGSMRASVLMLALFFIIAFVIFTPLRKEKRLQSRTK